jgi:pilus assembly protein Flp/PilA
MLLAYMRARIGLARQEGQALVEYALIISLVAVFLIAALTFMRGKVEVVFSTIGSKLG